MGQILPGVVVLAFSLKGKNNRMANGMRIPTVVLAFSLKGKNNWRPEYNDAEFGCISL